METRAPNYRLEINPKSKENREEKKILNSANPI